MVGKLELIYLIVGITLGWLAQSIQSYVRRKGENLATKEDVAEITREVERVKHEYASQAESIRTSLLNRLNLNSFRYEKEFQILDDLTNALINVRDTARQLRPIMDSYDPNEDERDRKNRRLGQFFDASKELYRISEYKRPFYPAEIYDLITRLAEISRHEAIRYRYHSPDDPKHFDTYWEEAEKNSEEISQRAQSALDAIRERVVSWEDIP